MNFRGSEKRPGVRRAAGCGLILLAALWPGLAGGQSFDVDWFAIAGGGGESSDGTVVIFGTIGQFATEELNGSGLTLMSGFLSAPTGSPDNSVQFVTNLFTAEEWSGIARLAVERTGDASQPASVTWSVVGGTASLGSDYVESSGTLGFAAEQTIGFIELTLINDVSVEGTETVIISLSGPAGASLGSPALSSLAIVDDDTGPPLIRIQPLDQIVCINSPATFLVVASGAPPLSYQWWFGGTILDGGTTSLTIPNAHDIHQGDYRVVITNLSGSVTSNPAVLRVGSCIAPADDFALRTVLSDPEGCAAGANLNATAQEPDEPNHAGKPGGSSVWYEWTAPTNGLATFRIAGSTFDTLLAVYTGTTLGSLIPVASNDDAEGQQTSAVAFRATARTTYMVAIDGYTGEQGRFLLCWMLEHLGDSIPFLTRQPACGTVRAGDSYLFDIEAEGVDLQYQWLFNGAPLLGEINEDLQLLSVTPEQVGFYAVEVTDSSSSISVTSRWALLEIGPVPTIQSADKVADFLGDPCAAEPHFPAAFMGAFQMVYEPAIAVRVGATDNHIMTSTGSLQACDARDCTPNPRATRWLPIVPGISGSLYIDTCGSPNDTILSAYYFPKGATDWCNRQLKGCSTSSSGRPASVRFQALGTERYYLMLDSSVANSRIHVNWLLEEPAPLTPQSHDLPIGRSANLLLNTNRLPAGTASYTWQLNGVDLPWTNVPMLSPCNVCASVGHYSVQARSSTGTVLDTIPIGSVQIDPFLITLAESTFDCSDSQWVARSNTVTSPPACIGAGGGRGDYIFLPANQNLLTWDWQAPPSFLGNKSAAYGSGWLEFSLRQPSTQVALGSSAGMRLTTNIVVSGSSGPDWYFYKIPLVENGWRRGTAAASQADFISVLSDLNSLEIRCDSRLGDGGLDDVAIITRMDRFGLELRHCQDSQPPCPVALCSGLSQWLEWPLTTAEVELQSTVDLSQLFQGWTKWPGTILQSGGMNLAPINQNCSHSQQFFRLKFCP